MTAHSRHGGWGSLLSMGGSSFGPAGRRLISCSSVGGVEFSGHLVGTQWAEWVQPTSDRHKQKASNSAVYQEVSGIIAGHGDDENALLIRRLWVRAPRGPQTQACARSASSPHGGAGTSRLPASFRTPAEQVLSQIVPPDSAFDGWCGQRLAALRNSATLRKSYVKTGS